MIGPAMLHSNKQKETFAILFHEITKRIPHLATNLSTDGEIALFEAAADAFPLAIHLRCVNHFRDNVTEYLRKQLLPDCVVKQ